MREARITIRYTIIRWVRDRSSGSILYLNDLASPRLKRTSHDVSLNCIIKKERIGEDREK